jgi:hypothetical protein
LEPFAQYDSWLTVCETGGNEGHESNVPSSVPLLASVGIDFADWSADHALRVTGGSIFWNEPTEAPASRNCVIAQLTMPINAEWHAWANVRGTTTSGADWSAQNLYFQ